MSKEITLNQFINKEEDTFILDSSEYSVPKWFKKVDDKPLKFERDKKSKTIILKEYDKLSCVASRERGLSIMCQESSVGELLHDFFYVDNCEVVKLPPFFNFSSDILNSLKCSLGGTWVNGRKACLECIVLSYPDNITLIKGTLEIENVTLCVSKLCKSTMGSIQGVLKIGEIGMIVYVGLGHHDDLTISISSTEKSFPSMMDFFFLLVKEMNIGDAFKNLPCGDGHKVDVALVSASVTLNAKTGKLNSFYTKGLIALWGMEFDCAFYWPYKKLTASLNNKQEITISKLVENICGVGIDMEVFEKIGLGSCIVEINMGEKMSYHICCTLKCDLSLGPFTLTSVSFSIDIENETNIYLSGKITVSKDKYLSLDVRYDSATKDWILSGGIRADSEITLKELLDLLRVIPGFPPMPDFLNCVGLEYLNLTYYTKQKKLLYEVCGKLSLPTSVDLTIIPFITQVLPEKFNYEDNGLVLAYEKGKVTEGSIRIEYPKKKESPKEEEKEQLAGGSTFQMVETVEQTREIANVSAQEEGDSKVRWMDVNRQLGPAYLERVGILMDGAIVGVQVKGAVSIGPITVEMFGLWAGYNFSNSCVTGGLNGLGIAYLSPAFSIAGSLYKMNTKVPDIRFAYGGSILVKTAKWQLVGIGSYSLFNDGTCSLFLFVRFMALLGGVPSFQIQGLMGGLGVNKSLRLPKVEQVEEFPLLNMKDGEESKVLTRLEKGDNPWLKSSKGDYWVAVGIEFSSFGLIYGRILLAILLGRDLSISLLGTAELTLPKGCSREKAYAYIKILLAAVLKPEEGVLTVDAAISKQSFLLSKKCHLQGGAAYYMWFGSNPHAGDFVLTVGGYHPNFKPPKHYPAVERVGFQWSESSSVSIKGEAYMAITPSCIMAGGRLEFLYAKGCIRAWFIAYADILVQWHPFWFDARVGVEIGVSARLNFLFFHKTIKLSLGADLHLWGPAIGGRAKIHLYIISFSINFGAGRGGGSNLLAWSEFSKVISEEAKNQIRPQDGFEKIDKGETWVVRGTSISVFTETSIPVGKIALRPMGVSEVESTYDLVLKDKDGKVQTLESAGLVAEVVRGNFPKALWGNPKESSMAMPMTVDGLASGYKITQRPFVAGKSLEIKTLLQIFNTTNPLNEAVNRVENPAFIPQKTEKPMKELQNITNDKVYQARLQLCKQLSSFYKGPEGTYVKLKEDLEICFTDVPLITEGGRL